MLARSPRPLLCVAIVVIAGCRSTPEAREPVLAPSPKAGATAETAPEDRALLDQLAAAATAKPNDFAALKAAGMAHMWATLSGELEHQARAEAWLEQAFALREDDVELNVALGRFYNLRAVANDDSKAHWQVRVYTALLGDTTKPPQRPAMFVAWSFMKLGQVLTEKKQGKLFAALGTVKELEAALEKRTQAHPDDIEMFALAGNFSFFFAGNIPTEKRERLARAVAYFEVVRARWGEVRAGARNTAHCPNTYENFMFELAEGYTALGKLDKAKPIYEELGHASSEHTIPKQQIARVSEERLEHLDAYAAKMALMPPWPSDEANCIVCHSYTGAISTESLHTLEPMDFGDLRTTASQPLSVLRPGP